MTVSSKPVVQRTITENGLPGGVRRVLHVIGGMRRGGAESLVMSLYRRLDRAKVQFDFAVNTENHCDFDSEIQGLGGRIIPHPAPAEAGFGRWRKALESTLLGFGPFVAVHSHNYFFTGYALRAASDAGIPLRLAHSHSTSDGRENSLLRGTYRWWMRKLIQRHATHMLGCSRSACESLYGPSCWLDSRVRVLSNAIDLSDFDGLPADSRSLRDRLSLPADKFLIGHVGRFHPVKNHRRLIGIFWAVWKRNPEARLVLIGDGPLRPEIESIIRERGLERYVHLLGLRDDVPKVLGALDAFIFPSIYEGFPISLLEAQAAGLPCVVSDMVLPDADAGMGLIRFVSLNESDETWADKVVASRDATRIGWEDRKKAFRAAGYDIGLQVMELERIYTGDGLVKSRCLS